MKRTSVRWQTKEELPGWTRKVMIPVGRKAESEFLPFTLIAYKGKHNKESIVFITNGHFRSSREIRRRLTAYFKRWK